MSKTRKSAKARSQQPEHPAGPYFVAICECVENGGYDHYLERGLTEVYGIETHDFNLPSNFSLSESREEAQSDVDELNRLYTENREAFNAHFGL